MSRSKEIQKDLDVYSKLEALSNLEGGKHLISLLLTDVTTAVDTIAGNYKELSHAELIAQSARLSERLAMYRLITGSKKNSRITRSLLEEALKEEESD